MNGKYTISDMLRLIMKENLLKEPFLLEIYLRQINVALHKELQNFAVYLEFGLLIFRNHQILLYI